MEGLEMFDPCGSFVPKSEQLSLVCGACGFPRDCHVPGFPSSQLPLQAALGDFGAVKTALDRDRDALPVDLDGPPPFTFHTHIPMDDGSSECRPGVDRGFYRAYDANWTDTPTNTVEMPLIIEGLDVNQIGWEIARESPVTGSVVFRLVDGRIVAQLTSYVAFA